MLYGTPDNALREDETAAAVPLPASSMGERWSNAIDAQQKAYNLNSALATKEAEFDKTIDGLFELTGQRFDNPMRAAWIEVVDGARVPRRSDPVLAFEQRIDELAAQQPDKSREILAFRGSLQRAYEARNAAVARDADAVERSQYKVNLPLLGPVDPVSMAGGMWGSLSDPTTLIVNAIGSAGTGARLGYHFLRAGLINAGAEVAQQPFIKQWANEAGDPYGWDQAARSVVASALLGGALDTAVRGSARGIQRARGLEPVRKDGLITGWRSPAEKDAALDAAATRLPADNPVRRAAEGDVAAVREIAEATGAIDDPALRGAIMTREMADGLEGPPAMAVDGGEGFRSLAQSLRNATDPDEPPPARLASLAREQRIEDLAADAPHRQGVVAFHGTPYDFDVFNLPKNDVGIHFGTEAQARARLETVRDLVVADDVPEGVIKRAVLDVNNPLELPDGGWSPSSVAEKLVAAGVIDERTASIIKATDDPRGSQEAAEAVRDIIEGHGYDAIRYRNEAEGTGWSYIVWSPGTVRDAADPNRYLFSLPPEQRRAQGAELVAGTDQAPVHGTLLGRRETAEAAPGGRLDDVAGADAKAQADRLEADLDAAIETVRKPDGARKRAEAVASLGAKRTPRPYTGPKLEPAEVDVVVTAWRDLAEALDTTAARTATRTPEQAQKLLDYLKRRTGKDVIEFRRHVPLSFRDVWADDDLSLMNKIGRLDLLIKRWVLPDWSNVHTHDVPVSRLDFAQKAVVNKIVGDYVSGARNRSGPSLLKYNPKTGRYLVIDGTHRAFSEYLQGRKVVPDANVIYDRPWHHRLFGIKDETVRTLASTLARELEDYGIEPGDFADEAGLRRHLSGETPRGEAAGEPRRGAGAEEAQAAAERAGEVGSSKPDTNPGDLADLEIAAGRYFHTAAATERMAEIRSEIDRTVKMLPSDVQLRVQDELIDFGHGRVAQGAWDGYDRVVYVSLAAADPVRTMRHETVHALRQSGLMTDREFDTLYQFAESAGLRKAYAIDENYSDLYGKIFADRGDAGVEALLREETIADMFADYSLNGRRFADEFGPRGRTIDKILDAIVKFLKAVREALHIRGFDDVRDVFEAIESGAMAQRQAGRVALPGGAEIEGFHLFALKAFHGTPHAFEPEPGAPAGRFRADKIGTGEGAQAYGHGLYFAESEGVAASYREGLSDSSSSANTFVDGQRINESPMPWLIHYISGNVEDAKAIAGRIQEGVVADQKRADELYRLSKTLPKSQRAWGRAQGDIAADRVTAGQKQLDQLNEYLSERPGNISRQKPGKLYEVSIKADQQEFLDWDKPLADQSEMVRKAILPIAKSAAEKELKRRAWNDQMNDRNMRETWGKEPAPRPPQPTADDLALRMHGNEIGPGNEAALREAGIPGIRYLDGSSRGAGQGTSNYVIFPGNEHLIEIVAVDGKPVVSLAQDLADAKRDVGLGKLVEACRL